MAELTTDLLDAPSFDGQATHFEDRAGLPEAACIAVVAAIVEIGALRSGDRVLECGAGTGRIGGRLASRPEFSYVGFDVSAAMIEAFRGRMPDASRATIVQADGNGRWPVEDRSVRTVFGVRCFHLMAIDHVVQEVHRVAAAEGATLLVGRVERDRDSVANRMRRALREVMSARGLSPRRGGRQASALLDACVARGGVEIGEHVAARWAARSSPQQSLDAWRAKEGLAGLLLAPTEKASVLDEVQGWARESLGDLDAQQPFESRFTFHAVRIGGSPR